MSTDIVAPHRTKKQTKSPQLRGISDGTGFPWNPKWWRRRESNPRPKGFRRERLRAYPAVWVSPGFAPAGGLSSRLVRLGATSSEGRSIAPNVAPTYHWMSTDIVAPHRTKKQTKSPQLRGISDGTGFPWNPKWWRRRESNPRPKGFRRERLRAYPAVWVSPGFAPAGGLSSRLVRLDLATAPYGPKETVASPLHGVQTLSRGRGEEGRSLAN